MTRGDEQLVRDLPADDADMSLRDVAYDMRAGQRQAGTRSPTICRTE